MPVLPEVGSRIVWPGSIAPRCLGVLDHRLGDAVLDRAGRVVALELGPDAHAGLGREARQLDERRVADRLEDVLEAAPAGAIEERLLEHRPNILQKVKYGARNAPPARMPGYRSAGVRSTNLKGRSDEMRQRLLAMLAALVARARRPASPSAAATTTTTASDSGGGGDDLEPDHRTVSCSVGTDTPYPPFEIGQPPDIWGFDIEVMNAIAEELGLEVDLPGHRVRHDLPRHRATASSTPRPPRRRSRPSASRRSTSPIPTTRPRRRCWWPRDSDIATTADLGGKIVGAQDGDHAARPTPTTRPTPPRSAGSPRAPTRSRRWPPARSTR